MTQLTNNDSELLPITGSLRSRAKSSTGFPNRLAPSPVGGALFNTVNISESSVSSVAKNKKMQNEPNFKNPQINLSPYKTKNYENKRTCEHRQNEPNTNPIVYRAAVVYVLLKHVNSVFGKYAGILGEGNNFIDFYIRQLYPLLCGRGVEFEVYGDGAKHL